MSGLVLSSIAAGLSVQGGSPQPQRKAYRKQEPVRQTILTWLECDECTEGQLEAVVKLGLLAMPRLTQALLNGPSAGTRALKRDHLIETYHKVQSYQLSQKLEPLAMSEREYVQLYLRNFTALYQTRAARALAAIGGEQARKALTTALKLRLRKDVRAAVRDSLERINNPK